VDINMKVNLVGITKPVGFAMTGEIHTAEDLIVYCARVSNPNNQHNTITGDKLLSYMVRNKHWSPFEMVNVVMEIETTRDIARQILRHRSFSFQEFSQRYASVTEMSEPREARMQDDKNRQNSIETNDQAIIDQWNEMQEHQLHIAKLAYSWAIEHGIAKEVARSVLPEGLTMSRLYMSGTLRSWIHYADLRTGNGTQKEHHEIAEACKAILMTEFPFLDAYWKEDGYIPFA
jgi:thymidylate synthase (FAD)